MTEPCRTVPFCLEMKYILRSIHARGRLDEVDRVRIRQLFHVIDRDKGGPVVWPQADKSTGNAK